MKPAEVMRELEQAARSARSADELMGSICERLHQHMLKYNWVGFYMIQEDGGERVLQLGRFVGSMTPHTRIQLHQGICGAAASTGKTVIVDDVISTGSTLQGMRMIMEKAGATIVGEAAILTEGERAKWEKIISLGHLPLFTN